jgi:hypothetical protein
MSVGVRVGALHHQIAPTISGHRPAVLVVLGQTHMWTVLEGPDRARPRQIDRISRLALRLPPGNAISPARHLPPHIQQRLPRLAPQREVPAAQIPEHNVIGGSERGALREEQVVSPQAGLDAHPTVGVAGVVGEVDDVVAAQLQQHQIVGGRVMFGPWNVPLDRQRIITHLTLAMAAPEHVTEHHLGQRHRWCRGGAAPTLYNHPDGFARQAHHHACNGFVVGLIMERTLHVRRYPTVDESVRPQRHGVPLYPKPRLVESPVEDGEVVAEPSSSLPLVDALVDLQRAMVLAYDGALQGDKWPFADGIVKPTSQGIVLLAVLAVQGDVDEIALQDAGTELGGGGVGGSATEAALRTWQPAQMHRQEVGEGPAHGVSDVLDRKHEWRSRLASC